MPFLIVEGDITKMKVDAVVNAANESLLGGGGVDGAIHRAAGPQLMEECAKLNGCDTGEAKITKGYRLPCRYIIHTVGPIWRGGKHHEEEALISCYEKSLALAEAHDCESVAFPLISSGIYGYPKEEALSVAVRTIRRFLDTHDRTVYLVIFDRKAYTVEEGLFASVRDYLGGRMQERGLFAASARCLEDVPVGAPYCEETAIPRGLDDRIRNMDESFSQMLLRKITEEGMTDAQCYRKANIDRRLFSKIRSDVHYRPSKQTVAAFAVALELDLDETRELLEKAGYALSHSSKADIILEYFIGQEKYDIDEINEVLFAFDQALLGA